MFLKKNIKLFSFFYIVFGTAYSIGTENIQHIAYSIFEMIYGIETSNIQHTAYNILSLFIKKTKFYNQKCEK